MVKARRVSPRAVAISVSGSVNHSTAEYVTRVAEYMLDHVESTPDRVELDLTDVTGVDEVGFTSLVDVAAGATASGAAVVVRCGAERAMLESHRGGRGLISEQISRMLRVHLKFLVRRRASRRAMTDARVVRWCPGPLANRSRG
ncbi:STAS domain-containing protein [Micromonospora sp. HNM0581]|uniref:STAS domain-containing protein n=1 Tax=Micromonospora sp. HNM0581 TaxID=2716341 RepID=UPI00197BDAA5|nr:STAS domain-containing protein [Micromonospora sp. HNM0581]